MGTCFVGIASRVSCGRVSSLVFLAQQQLLRGLHDGFDAMHGALFGRFVAEWCSSKPECPLCRQPVQLRELTRVYHYA